MANPFRQELQRREQGNPFRQELQRRTSDQAPATPQGAQIPQGDPQAGAAGLPAVQQTPQAQGPRQRASRSQAFNEFGLRGFTDSILGLPSAVGELLADGSAVLQTATGALASPFTGESVNILDRFSDAREQQRNLLPASALINAPIPNTQQLIAAGDVAGEVFGDIASNNPVAFDPRGRFDRALAAREERSAQIAEDQPNAARAGSVTGNVGALLAGRAPIAARLRDFTNPNVAARPVSSLPPGIRREFAEIRDKPFFRGLGRGVNRAAETGLEGAFLAALNEGDPVTTAMLSAAAQSGGSLSLWLAKGPVKRLAPTVIGGTIAFQMFAQANPTMQQNIFDSLDTSISKVLGVIGIGALSGLSGLGRLPRSTQENLGLIGDSITPALRTPLLSAFGALTAESESGEDAAFRVLEQYSADVNAFGERFGSSAKRRLERALSKDADAVRKISNELMRDRKFRRTLEQIAAEQEGPEVPF